MRAATPAHPSVASATTARATLGDLALVLLATLMLLLVWRPTVVHAQLAPASAQGDSTTLVHQVKAGESWWGLAERYYGDGRRWPELVRRNALAPTRGHILLVGAKLKVPATASAATLAKTATPKSGGTKVGDAVPAYVRAAAVSPTNAAPTSAPSSPASASQASASRGGSLAAQTADKADAVPSSARPPRAATTQVADGASRRAPVASSSAPKAAITAAAAPPKAAITAAAAPPKAAPPKTAPPTAATPAAATPVASHTSSEAPTSNALPRVAAQDSGRTFAARVSRQSETLIDRKTTRIGLVNRDDLDAARSPTEAATVFLRHVPDASEVDAQARALSRADQPTARRGEYEAAPFSLEFAAIAKGGRLRHRVGSPAGEHVESPQRVTLADEVEISAPTGLTLAAGDRLVVLKEIAPVGKKKGPVVVVPTGILQILPTAPGRPLRAFVQKQTGNIEQGQLLLPVEGSAVAPSVTASVRADSDVETTVRWLDASESLPTLQSYLLLGAGRSQGVQAGDEFELRTARGAARAGNERIARVRIVRVGATESAGIVVGQERSDIAVGVTARRVARVP